jgi:dihydrofolate reductase
MGKVFIHVTMSLDGIISKPDETDTAWMFKYGSDDEMAKRIMGEIGAVVLGNKGFREGTMTVDMLPYGGMKVPQFVVTHHDHEPVTIGPLTFTFVTGGIEQAIKLAKEAAGDKRVALLGASIDQQCLKAGLVDEIVIHLLPVLLGDGISLFGRLGGKYELEREEVVTAGQLTSLRFSVVR